MTGPSLSVVFPAYNEADGIAPALEEASSVLEELRTGGVLGRWEILVVDDGSNDGTGDLVRKAAIDEPRIRLVEHERNRGVGAGLRSALAEADGDLVLYTDADMPVDLGMVGVALPLLDAGTGLVAGRRARYDAEGRFRAISSRAFDVVAQLLFGVTVPDVNFPFKLFARSTGLAVGLRSEGALVDVELLAGVEGLGLRIESLVMEYRSRQFGTSKTMSVRLLSKLAVEALRHRRSIRAGTRQA